MIKRIRSNKTMIHKAIVNFKILRGHHRGGKDRQGYVCIN